MIGRRGPMKNEDRAIVVPEGIVDISCALAALEAMGLPSGLVAARAWMGKRYQLQAQARATLTQQARAPSTVARPVAQPRPANRKGDLHMLMTAIAKQTDVLSSLTARSAGAPPRDALGSLIGDVDAYGGTSNKLPGARGAAAMEMLRRSIQSDPAAVSARVRGNRNP